MGVQEEEYYSTTKLLLLLISAYNNNIVCYKPLIKCLYTALEANWGAQSKVLPDTQYLITNSIFFQQDHLAFLNESFNFLCGAPI